MERAIEAATVTYAGMNKQDVDGLYPKIGEIPFSSDRMMMTTVTAINGNPVAVVKGAPEIIASKCTDANDNVIKAAHEFAAEGLKVIAVAIKPLAEIPAILSSNILENELSFVGIIGFEDAVEESTAQLCKECINSDIKIVMITGDHIDTATAVGMKLGIISDESLVISAEKLAEIPEIDFNETIIKYRIFARVSPDDKLRIVSAFRAAGEKVLVTGDSLNDTRTLLSSDIGCALGKTASDIAKDSADLVVNDNKFSSIITAFKESVRIFTDIKKAVAYTLSAILTILSVNIFGLIIFGSTPISSEAIILCGLISLTLPLFAIIYNGAETTSAFKLKDIKIFNKDFIYSFVIPTLYISVISCIGFAMAESHAIGASVAFASIMISLVVHAFSLTFNSFILSKNTITSFIGPLLCLITIVLVVLFAATPLGVILSFDTLESTGIFITIVAAFGTLAIDEGIKFFKKL
jgi:Ca2+-transporting ATPase